MRRIRKLPDRVANQIAAGEVVERPASVVKELLENAVDAGATRVRVEIEGGGTGLIAVTDDGRGMSPDDARLAIERHATSKITSADDLGAVETFGFRGEALPSIASVSRFVLVTREAESDEGTRVEVDGGRLTHHGAVGTRAGTRIEVADLFFNVPARRKFLKRPATEMGHISDAVERVALAHPEIAIKLENDGRVVLDVPRAAAADPKGWLRRILGKRVAEHLYPIEGSGAQDSDGPARVHGWLASPLLSERTTRGLYTFVNGRFVRDRTVQHAVKDAYRTVMERGRHPVVVLMLDVDPSFVDVNVHPQKTEVRFENTQPIHRAITRALGAALAAQPWMRDLALPASAVDMQSGLQGADYTSDRPAPSWLPQSAAAQTPAVRNYALDPSPGAGLDEHRARMADAVAALGRGGGKSASSSAWGPEPEQAAPWTFQPAGAPQAPGSREARPRRFAGLTPIGQVHSTYLVCQGPEAMVLIDQHAAHERIAFERMRQQFARGQVEVQPLLVPQPIELEAGRAAVAAEMQDRLQAAGFELEPFGGSTWMLKAVPASLSGVDAERLVRDLLDDLDAVGEATPLAEAVESMLSCAACHTVVRAGDKLGREEIAALLTQMDEIDFGAHCPHGRPVFVEWSARDLAKLFHRS